MLAGIAGLLSNIKMRLAALHLRLVRIYGNPGRIYLHNYTHPRLTTVRISSFGRKFGIQGRCHTNSIYQRHFGTSLKKIPTTSQHRWIIHYNEKLKSMSSVDEVFAMVDKYRSEFRGSNFAQALSIIVLRHHGKARHKEKGGRASFGTPQKRDNRMARLLADCARCANTLTPREVSNVV